LADHVARMEEMRNTIKFWLENLKGRDHAEDLGRDGKISLEWILRKQDVKLLNGCIWLRIGTSSWLL